MKSKFFRVTCKCGHVGRQFFIRIDFPVAAFSRKEAAKIARSIPRVKHDRKDAILNCIEIDHEEYLILQMINRNDPYLQCKNKQEQTKIFGFEKRIEPEPQYITKIKKDRKDIIQYKQRKEKQKIMSHKLYETDDFSYFEYACC